MQRAGSPKSAVVFQPANALLVLDRNPCRVNFLLEGSGAFELLAGPELDCGQTQGHALRRDRQARMHQKSADSVHPETAILAPAAVDAIGEPDPLRPLPLVGKLGGVLEHQDRPLRRRKTLARRVEMAGQDLRFADPLIGKEAVGGLGVRPVLAGQRNARPDGVAHTLEQAPQALGQTPIRQAAAGNLAIKPSADRSVHWHRSPETRRQRMNHEQMILRNTLCAPNCHRLNVGN